MKKHLPTTLLLGRMLLLLLGLFGLNATKAQTNVTGNQSGTWTKANSPYVINGIVTVPAGLTLTIQAGVEVRSSHFDNMIDVEGILKAIGTPVDSIRFNGFANTAYNANSTHGGLIYLNSANTSDSSVLAYVAIDRMGDKDYWTSDQAAVDIGNGKVTIRNSVIRNSELRGIFGVNQLARNPIVASVSFTNNPVPMYMYANNVGSFSNNVNAAITLRGTSFTNAAVNFPKPGTASYYIMEPGGTYTFSGCRVTIQPGAEFRSMSFDNEFAVSDSGVLIARGTAADSIRFVGYSNPAYDPASTHGGLIYLNSSIVLDSSVLAYIAIDHMGDKDYWTSDQTALELGNGKVTVRNSSIRNSELRGIFGYNQLVYNPIVSNVVFTNNPVQAYLYANNVGGFSNNTNAVITLRSTNFNNGVANFPKPGTASYYIMEPGGQYSFSDANVTIQPGAEFRSMSYDNQFSISGSGVLKAIGTATDSIRFVGYANTAYAPTSSHGGLIYFNSSNTTDSSVLAYAAIDHMGDKDYYTGDEAALELGNGKITIRNCNIRNSELRGIFGYNQLAVNPIVASNTFINNPLAAYLYANNVGSFGSNTNAAVTLRSTSFSNAAVNFPKPGTTSYYIMEPGGNYAFSDGKVTIQPGAEFRSMSYDNQFSVSGTGVLVAKGTVTDSIRFTGYANTAYNSLSTHGGLLYMNSNNTTDSSVFAYFVMEKMGDKDYWTGDQAAFEIGNGKIRMTNSSIRNSENRGIFGYGNASGLAVRKSNILYNKYGGDFTSGKPLFYKCNIVGNTLFGINNQSTTDTVDARTCWWGDSTGPKQTSTNPLGKGNAVSLRVLYKPFLLYPYQNNDLGVDSIYTPVTNCGLSAGETVKVRIRNFGSATQTGFNVSYKINTGAVVTENVGTVSIASDSTIFYSFTTKANLSTGGGTVYKIVAFTGLTNDTIKLNDTAKATVVNNKPMLGKDSTVKVCPGYTTSIKNLYTTTGYTSVVWSTTKPDSVGVGTYSLIVTNSFGCKDTAIVTVAANVKPALGKDTTVKICAGSITSIKTLYVTTGYTSVVWSTPKPDSVGAGTYTLIVTNSTGCKDTAVVTVSTNPKPALGKDTTYKICAGNVANITTLYNTTGYTSIVWSTTRPDSVGAGTYTLIVTNSFGCKDTTVVTVATNPKPALGIDKTVKICVGSSTNLTTLYTTTGYTSVVWSTTRPDSVTTKGNYTLTVTNSFGCKDTAVVSVDTISLPTKPVISFTIGAATGLCNGDSAVLNAVGYSDTTIKIQWLRNDTLITGATKTTLVVKTTGNYKLRYTNATGCVSLSNVQNVTFGGTKPTKPVLTLTGNKTFCLNDSLVMTTTATGPYQWTRNNNNIPNATTNRYVVKVAGTYKLRVTNGGSCSTLSDSVVAVVTQVTKPTISLVADTLVSSSATGNQWYKGGVLIAGATAQKYKPTDIDFYTVQVTSGTCKSPMSEPFMYTAGTRMANHLVADIYPNPTTGLTTINVAGTSKPVAITVTDLAGKVVKRFDALNIKTNTIDLSSLVSGSYFVTVTDGIQQKVLKVIKQ